MRKFLLATCTLLLLSGCEQPPSKVGSDAQVSSQKLTDQGFELMKQQQPRAAIAMFDQAIGTDPGNVRAYQGKGLALGNEGQNEQAERVYEQGLKIVHGDMKLTNNLAMSKILRGQYEEAVTLLVPYGGSGNVTMQENLALANCLLGRKEEARKLYGKSLTPAQIEENLRFCNKYEAIRTKK